MRRIRLREMRKARGLTVRGLADLAGVDHATISRIEGGKRGMSVAMAEHFAKALDTTPAHLLGIEHGVRASATSGLMEDASPYALPDDTAAPIMVRRSARDTVSSLEVKTAVLDGLGYQPGDVIFVDIGQAAVDALQPLQCVVAQVYDDMTAVTVLRQFVPPSLLITNSGEHNLMPLNLESDDVAIKGVIVGRYTPAAR